MTWTRRHLLQAGASALLVWPRSALALGEASKVDVAELQLSSGTSSRPSAWLRLLYEVAETTSVETMARAVTLEPDDPDRHEGPAPLFIDEHRKRGRYRPRRDSGRLPPCAPNDQSATNGRSAH